MAKTKYLVKMNWYGQVYKIYTSSSSEHGALANAISQLSKRTGYVRGYVSLKYLGFPDNYKITERKWL